MPHYTLALSVREFKLVPKCQAIVVAGVVGQRSRG